MDRIERRVRDLATAERTAKLSWQAAVELRDAAIVEADRGDEGKRYGLREMARWAQVGASQITRILARGYATY
jgi:hypothetical protein